MMHCARCVACCAALRCAGLISLDLSRNPLSAMSIERLLRLLKDELMFARR